MNTFLRKKSKIILLNILSWEAQKNSNDEDDVESAIIDQEELLEETMNNTLFNKFVGQITKEKTNSDEK